MPNPFFSLFGIDEVLRRLDQMSVDQARFDEDLQALISAVGDLVTAVDALLSKQTDFSAEDQAVKDAAQQVQDELAKINPPTT